MTLIINLTSLRSPNPPHNYDHRNDHPFPPPPSYYHHHCLDQRGSPGYIIIIITMITTMSTNTLIIILLFLIIIIIAFIREGVLATVSPQVKEAVWPATSFIVTSSSGGLNYQVYILDHYDHIQESN